MTPPLADSLWLNDVDVCSIEELAEASRLSISEIEDLVASGVIAPVELPARSRVFRLQHIVTLNTARRLRDDFLLDHHGLALALILLQRIERLQVELTAAHAKLPRRS